MKTREKTIKSFQLEMKDMDDKTGEVAFYFAAFGKDLEGDIIEKSAYSKTLKENFSNLYHNRDHTEACGVPKIVDIDNKGAYCVSQLAIKTVVGNDTYEQYKAGIIKGHSQEFETIKDQMDMVQKARIIKELRLWGVTSVTNIPANLDTPTLSIKSFEDVANQMKKINDLLCKGNISDNLGNKFVSEYIRMKNFMLSNKEQLDALGIIHCKNCNSIMEEMPEDGKCPECKRYISQQSKKSLLITDEFISKIKLF
jgi:HK97 family phage prohead protease